MPTTLRCFCSNVGSESWQSRPSQD